MTGSVNVTGMAYMIEDETGSEAGTEMVKTLTGSFSVSGTGADSGSVTDDTGSLN